jgi:diguanylate cyclase (GGDEF)-like protein/PAS domain S-box-containing protein
MPARLGLITCGIFDREVQAVQSSPDLQGVHFRVQTVNCDQTDSPWSGLSEAVAACRKDGCAAGLIGGYCLTRPVRELGLERSCRIRQESQCGEWVADKGLLDRLLQDGALPVLPGWLRDWEAHVAARWGGDSKAAQSYFRDVAGKVVLLDTGTHPGIDRELKAFGRFLRLPVEALPTGLEHFRLALSRFVLGWRLDLFRASNEDLAVSAVQRTTDRVRFGRLLASAAAAKTDEEAQAGLIDIFASTVAPGGAVFHPLAEFSGRTGPEGSPFERILVLNADHAWSGDRRDLYLKIAHDHATLGILEIADFGGPDRGEHELDLAVALARIGGLVLGSARMSREIGEARGRAASAEAALASDEEMLARVFNYPLGLYRTTPQGKILMATPTLARMLGFPDAEALKQADFWSFHADPRDRDNKRAFLDSTSMVGIFESQLRRTNGTLFWAEDSCRATKDGHGQILFYEGVIEDITARKQMKDEHARVVRLQTAVGEISERLLSPTPIEEMSALVLEQARRLTGSLSGFVGHVDQRTGALVPAALTPEARDLFRAHPEGLEHFHENSGLWRWILEEHRAVVTSMPSLDPRYRGMPDWHLPVGPFLAVPAIMSGAIVGLVVVANAENPYGERDLNAVERLAELYAIAVERTRTENELRDLSLVDELTKVYNRRGFLTVSEQQMKVAHRTRKEMTLFYLDLDDLKKINDSFGHEAGDAALVEAVEALRDTFRDSDIIARLGGDEFVVLAIDVADGRASALDRRLRERLEDRNGREGTAFPVSFSVGVARYDPDRSCSLQELIAQADRMMYQQKSSKKSAAAAA